MIISKEHAICVDCGNRDKTQITVWTKSHNGSNYCCRKCNSYNVEYPLFIQEVIKIKERHTDKKGKWHKEILLDEERNEELKEQVLVMDI